MTGVDTLSDWLLLVHIVAAMVWVGGVVVLTALVTLVLRQRDADAVARFIGNLRAIGPLVLAPAPVTLVAIGVWLALRSDAWSFDQLWIQLGLGLFAAAFLVGAAHQSRAAIAAERAADRGDAQAATRHLARWSWGMRLIVLLLIVATWDMVLKPGL